MLRDAAVALIGLRLGNRTDLDAAIVAEMQFVQSTILEENGTFLPWFLETEMSTASTVASDERVPVPADYLGPIEDEVLWLYDATATPVWTALKKDSPRILRTRFTAEAAPQRYALTDEYFLLGPVPDAVYTLKMRYYAAEPALTTNIENRWLKYASDWVIAATGQIMAGQYLQNAALARLFEDAATIARSRLYVKHEARQHTGRPYQMGED